MDNSDVKIHRHPGSSRQKPQKTEDIGGKKNREAELCRAVETVIQ